MNVAVVHGNYFQRGGGEYVADAIARAFDAPLYYGFGNEDALPDDDIERRQLFEFSTPASIAIDRLAERVYQFRDLCFMWYGQHLPELYDYDVIIQSGNEFGWCVPTDEQVVLKYVHSPPRSSYDLFYKHGDSKLQRAYAMSVRTLYRPTTTFPDAYLANSELVQRRIRKYWGHKSQVVYPPVDLDGYAPGRRQTDSTLYLTYNRLYRHKRTREIVEAFEYLPDRRLVVGGAGPERDTLESVAPENVDIRGYLSEAEKRDLLSAASGLIYNPINEDFGIIPIEAFASGTPVIGVRDGFTKYQIRDGENGVLYPNHTSKAVHDGIKQFEVGGVSMGAEELERFARQFGRDRFERELRQAVEAARGDAAIEEPAMWADQTAEPPEVTQ